MSLPQETPETLEESDSPLSRYQNNSTNNSTNNRTPRSKNKNIRDYPSFTPLSHGVPEPAKKYRIFKNGDTQSFWKEFVLNKRRIKTWDSFLQQVTNDLKYPVAVRSIRTPTGGTRIHNLDELDDKEFLVAIGNGRFVNGVRYLEIGNYIKERSTPRKSVDVVEPVIHSRIRVPSKVHDIEEKAITIEVHRNGDNLQPPKRITIQKGMFREALLSDEMLREMVLKDLLIKKDMISEIVMQEKIYEKKWARVLGEITDKIGCLTTCLYTPEGEKLKSPLELKTRNDEKEAKGDLHYVAVDKKFKKMEYLNERPAFNTAPKQTSERRFSVKYSNPIPPPTINRPTRKARASSNKTDGYNTSNETPKSNLSTRSNPIDNKPQLKHKPSPRALPGIQKQKGKEPDSVFHAKPVKHRRQGDKINIVDYDKDEGGVFKPKSRHQETRGARTVEDTQDTHVDLPIDQVEAEQIEDEDADLDDGTSIPSNTELSKLPS